MRATLRKNGEYMITVAVKFDLSRTDLERRVIDFLDGDGIEYVYDWARAVPETRKDIMDAMRLQLEDNGPWNDGSWDQVTDRQKLAAAVIVKKTFPELYPVPETLPEVLAKFGITADAQ